MLEITKIKFHPLWGIHKTVYENMVPSFKCCHI
jgi:hypothetical protein